MVVISIGIDLRSPICPISLSLESTIIKDSLEPFFEFLDDACCDFFSVPSLLFGFFLLESLRDDILLSTRPSFEVPGSIFKMKQNPASSFISVDSASSESDFRRLDPAVGPESSFSLDFLLVSWFLELTLPPHNIIFVPHPVSKS